MEAEDREWQEPLDSGDPTLDRVAAAFLHRAARWKRFGVRPDDVLTQLESGVLTMAVDVGDRAAHVVLRTLRADFDGTRVLVGPDSTGQLVEPLAEGDGVRRFDVVGEAPEAIGQRMAEGLEPELLRSVVREEWDRPKYVRWVLADSGRVIVASSHKDALPARLGEPVRRIPVWGPFELPAG